MTTDPTTWPCKGVCSPVTWPALAFVCSAYNSHINALCTRHQGHDGDHVECRGTTHAAHVWSRTTPRWVPNPGAASTTAPAAPVEPGIRSWAPGAPSTRRPEDWLAWMADSPSTTDAIDAAIEADMHHSIMAYSLGKWIAENRTDELAARIAADFERLGVGR